MHADLRAAAQLLSSLVRSPFPSSPQDQNKNNLLSPAELL